MERVAEGGGGGGGRGGGGERENDSRNDWGFAPGTMATSILDYERLHLQAVSRRRGIPTVFVTFDGILGTNTTATAAASTTAITTAAAAANTTANTAANTTANTTASTAAGAAAAAAGAGAGADADAAAAGAAAAAPRLCLSFLLLLLYNGYAEHSLYTVPYTLYSLY
jgi:hypothetical protein